MFLEMRTYLLFIYSVLMLVFIPGSIRPVRFVLENDNMVIKE